MRRTVILIFCVIYLTMMVGVVKTTHFCMGREKGSSLFTLNSEKCLCVTAFAKPMSCCADKHALVQIEDAHAIGKTLSSPLPQFSCVLEVFVSDPPQLTVAYNIPEQSRDLLFVPSKVPLYRRNCSPLFYDALG